MEHIIVRDEQSEGIVINIGGLPERFAQLTDRRQSQGKIYPLWYLLMVIYLAKLNGQHTPTGIREWIRLRPRQLVEAMAAHWRPFSRSQSESTTGPSVDGRIGQRWQGGKPSTPVWSISMTSARHA